MLKLRVVILVYFFVGFLMTPATNASSIDTKRNNTLDRHTLLSKKKPNTFQCYVCFWTMNDEPCGDGAFAVAQAAPGKFMFNCLACYKQVSYEANGAKVKVLRGCAQERPHYALDCQKIFNEDGSYLETCACSKAYCNGAEGIVASALFLFLNSLVVILLIRSA